MLEPFEIVTIAQLISNSCDAVENVAYMLREGEERIEKDIGVSVWIVEADVAIKIMAALIRAECHGNIKKLGDKYQIDEYTNDGENWG